MYKNLNGRFWHMSFQTQNLTRTLPTIRQYQRIFKRFMRQGSERRLQRISMHSNSASAERLAVEVFLASRVKWTPATERLYFAAMIYGLDSGIFEGNFSSENAKQELCRMTKPHEVPMGNFDRPTDKALAIATLALVKQRRMAKLLKRRKSRKSGNTSTQKAKRVSEADIEAVIQQLDRSKSKWKNDTKNWFLAGILTGLRPAEWACASLKAVGNTLTLVVKNGKNTNGRSFGQDRKLIVSELTGDEKLLIKEHIERANAHETLQDFEAWYNRCRKLMHTISRVLWPKRTTYPTLYSARHLFAAAAKAEHSKREVAALMGHGYELTATIHYGRKKASNKKLRVSPSEDSIKALVKRNGLTPQANDFFERVRTEHSARPREAP